MKRVFVRLGITSLLLCQVFAQSGQIPQTPTPKSPSFEDMKIENVKRPDPNSTSPRDQKDLEQERQRAEHQRIAELMKEYRKTGNTSLTQDEIEDFAERRGFPKNYPRFKKVPTCIPRTLEDNCGVEGKWMVKLKPSVKTDDFEATVERLIAKYGIKRDPKLKGGDVLDGAIFFIEAPEHLAQQLSEDEVVRCVEQNQIGNAFSKGDIELVPKTKTELKATKPAKSGKTPETSVQTIPYWLDRLDERIRILDGFYAIPNYGSGVDIYHSGEHILEYHQEFQTIFGGTRQFPPSVIDYYFPVPDDCLKSVHDTSVASLATGKSIGVGSDSRMVIAAISDNLTVHFDAAICIQGLIGIKNLIVNQRPRSGVVVITNSKKFAPSTLNGPTEDLFDIADALVIVAAGKYSFSTETPAQFWPERVTRTMQIGWTDFYDKECAWENGGPSNPCNTPFYYPVAHLYAPGKNITAATNLGCQYGQGPWYDKYNYSFSGSSASAPIVAGVAAQFLSANKTFWAHWFQVKEALIQMSTPNVIVTEHQGITNKMLFNMWSALPASRNAASFNERSSKDALVASFGAFAQIPNRVFLNFETGGGEVECVVLPGATTGQVNFWTPPTYGTTPPLPTPNGTHAVKVYRNDVLLGYGVTKLQNTAPGFFTYNGFGTGIVSGIMYKYNQTTGALEEQVTLTSGGQGTNWTSNQNAFLVLFGTGWRNSSASVTVGGTGQSVPFSGAVDGFYGLDQVNVGPLPSNLKNSGVKSIGLTSGGVQSQAGITVNFAQ